jgi:hypothetical protein
VTLSLLPRDGESVGVRVFQGVRVRVAFERVKKATPKKKKSWDLEKAKIQ